jgi:molybdenum cofactor cytidylyltransferase
VFEVAEVAVGYCDSRPARPVAHPPPDAVGSSQVISAVAIVPAAGASRRMGRPKLLLPLGAGIVVGGVVDALRAGGADEVVLVVAPGDGELAAWARDQALTLAVNPRPQDGMLSSIRAGLAALGGSAALAAAGRPLLVTPADLPALSPATVRAVLAALADGAPLAVPLHRARRGHPLGIAAPLLPEIDHLDADVGLRQLLDRHAAAVRELPVDDPGAVEDIDTPEDYGRLVAPPDAPP